MIFIVILAANGYFITSWLRLVVPIIIVTVRERFTALRSLKVKPTSTAIAGEISDEKSETPAHNEEVMLAQITPSNRPESLEPPHNTSFVAEHTKEPANEGMLTVWRDERFRLKG